MRLLIAAAAYCVAAAHAWENTSPFLLFSSTSSQHLTTPQASLQPASAVLSTTNAFISSCPSDVYYVIYQPALSPLDFTSSTMPHLFRARYAPAVASSLHVPSVLGLDPSTLQKTLDHIKEGCGDVEVQRGPHSWDVKGALDRGKKAVLLASFEFDGAGLPKVRGEREEEIRNNDADVLTMMHNANEWDYTVIYLSTPLNGTIQEPATVYEALFEGQPHIELKRDLVERVPIKTVQKDERALFEKYQFFTPGIFMGIIVGIIMFMMLSVGISAVSSLQVSYGAFEKENNPANQKKQ